MNDSLGTYWLMARFNVAAVSYLVESTLDTRNAVRKWNKIAAAEGAAAAGEPEPQIS